VKKGAVIRLFLLALVAGAVLRCASADESDPSPCPFPPLAVFFAGESEPGLLLLDTRGTVLRGVRGVGDVGAVYNILMNKGAQPTPAEFTVSFDSKGEVTLGRYQVQSFTVSGEALVVSKIGDRFASATRGRVKVEPVVSGDEPCESQPELPVTVDVLSARGAVDTPARTIDGKFWRRLALDVDWSKVGCGVDVIRGRVILDVTAGSLAYNCKEAFRIVGDFEPPPSDGGPEGGSGATPGDAALDASSADANDE
jgi:hypothetical protein